MTEDMEKRVEEIRIMPIDYFTEDAEKIKDLFSAIDTLKEELEWDISQNIKILNKNVGLSEKIEDLESANKELKEHNDDMIEALEAAEAIKKADDKCFTETNARALSLEAKLKDAIIYLDTCKVMVEALEQIPGHEPIIGKSGTFIIDNYIKSIRE